MTGSEKKDEQRFNETLKRMLETPPKPRQTDGNDTEQPRAQKRSEESRED